LRNATDSRTDKDPEGGARCLAPSTQYLVEQLAQRQEGTRQRRAVSAVRKEKPLKGNPGRGCGVKQTRKAGGGASRRGSEKLRGRNEVSLGCSRVWTLPARVAKGNETPRKVLGVERFWAGTGRYNSEGEVGSQEDEPISKGIGDGGRQKAWAPWKQGGKSRCKQPNVLARSVANKTLESF
jgi:hypothetical protein